MKMLSRHAAPPVHGDRDLGVLEHAGEVEAGELAALVGVEDLGLAVSGHRLVQGLDAEPGIHGVRQPPRQDMARNQLALTAQAQAGVIGRDHRLAFPPAHRLSPPAKKSRSTVNWPILA